MKRRQRKPVLNINGESDSPRKRWPNERQSLNGSPTNPLANFLGQYNSDSEVEDDTRPRTHMLNDQVNDFLKEIQSITPEDLHKDHRNAAIAHAASFWQECYDEQTGYPYYWHTETNQVTWEMPPELKLYHEKCHQENIISHGSHISQWSNMSSNKFSQSQNNIPEGMIPKEVVVRNRNRQAGILNKPTKPQIKTNNIRSSGFSKDDDSDEGKIEMITSFGNDESDSDESEQENSQKKESLLKKSSLRSTQNTKQLAEPPTKNSELTDYKFQQKQIHLTVEFGPQNKEKPEEKVMQNLIMGKSVIASNVDIIEDDILIRMKNQAKLVQYIGSKLSSSDEGDEEKKSLSNVDPGSSSSKEIKLSLVPGYEDDSDGEEETINTNHKPLFPITETTSTDEKNIEMNIGTTKIYEYSETDTIKSDDKPEEEEIKSEDNTEERTEEIRGELEYKANKFLESIDAPSKAFQRKKRIAFDVIPIKSKGQEEQETAIGKDESPPDGETSERRGLEFTQEESTSGENSPVPDPVIKSEGEVTKKLTTSISKAGPEEDEDDSSKEMDEPRLKSLTEPILEKLKFLSEGRPAASAVQIMAIQIQTLLCAWESGNLQETYLRKWLVGTDCELTRLEQTAAPPGWECQWDRSHKRYYYRNATTGEAQWTYPDTDIVGGTEEMELCTTPPPPEQEETPIIEMSTQPSSIRTETPRKEKTRVGEQQQQQQQPVQQQLQQQQSHQQPSETMTLQPTPSVSNSSPLSPQRVFDIVDDVKRFRKRKASEDGILEVKEEIKKEQPRIEPLPPGVDSTEIAYTLPASAIEAGVLYGAQQTNPIYAATLAGAGIPILSHHHTALMQGQLVHYSPAYHQHLHNQALVAARLSGQEAVQFMVAEYARVYENNQVIAKPPMKMPHETSLGSALNSFYSDIASIEQKTTADIEKEKVELRLAESIPSPVAQVSPVESDTAVPEAIKEKKKKKLKTGIGKKQKEMSSMVAKWQRAQKNYKDTH